MTEQQAYEVVRSYDDFELRRYAPHVVAEVVVRAPFEDAGNIAFRSLFRYISGLNRPQQKVSMTAPVIQRQRDQEPVTEPAQHGDSPQGEYAVAFVLPSSLTLDTHPSRRAGTFGSTNDLPPSRQLAAAMVSAAQRGRPGRGGRPLR